ncbi:MAG: hypothetical protein AB8B82_05825 [Roseovarius sp.]
MPLIRLTVILCALVFGSALHAAEPIQEHNSTAVWFENWIGLTHGNMRVASPDGQITDSYAASGTPVFELTGGGAVDGVYRYELRASTEDMIKNRDYSEDSALEQDSSEYIAKPFYKTGVFIVERGVIITPKETLEENAGD